MVEIAQRMKKYQIIRISGQLAGTLFRQEARQQAERLGLTGTARLEANGDLRLEAEGDADALQDYINWCRTGPDGTHVRQVEVLDGELQGFDRFMELR